MTNTAPIPRDQYINWTPGSKVPCGPTGAAIDPHDPANWMSYDAAVATGLPVGFVLTESDPYFLLDLDKQRDPITGVWSDVATDLCARFFPAGQEVSQSGNGIHIIGTCDQTALADRRRKWKAEDGTAYEFYTSGRYVALSGNAFRGDTGHDCTSLLLDLVPLREDADGNLPEDGPVPEWSGPLDDDKLIERMLSTRGSVAVQFGDRASIRDLWDADEEQLSRFFPALNADDPFDRSSADAALMSHLAFWTGKDMARMDRLFRRSKLVRDKYIKRSDYRTSTIRGAASSCRSVLTSDAGGVVVEPDGTVQAPGTGGPVSEYLTVGDIHQWFAGCVYVTDQNRILTPGGALLGQQQFNAVYGGKEFQMSADGTRPTRNPWEAFTMNRATLFPKVWSTRFTPLEPFGAIRDGKVNTFIHRDVAVSNEPVDRYLDVLGRILPNERDRRIFLSWCAAMVQSPGFKFQWATVLQGAEGNGKTFLMTCLEHAVGRDVSHRPNPEDLNEKYNGYLAQALFIAVEEVHMEGRRDTMDRLKKYITNDRIEIREMGIDKRMMDNLTNWMFLTNHRDAILKTRNDRRYCVFFAAQQTAADLIRDGMGGRFFPDLWDWARNGGYAAVAGFLSRYEVDPEFDPRGACHRAPTTSTTEDAMNESLGPIEQEILDLIGQELPGFRGGWISSVRLKEHLSRQVSWRVLRDALVTLGYKPCPLWQDGRPGALVQEGGVRPRLYCTDAVATSCNSVNDYLTAQDYST
jgi:hypothetical protein